MKKTQIIKFFKWGKDMERYTTKENTWRENKYMRWTCVSCIGRQTLFHCATWKAPMNHCCSVAQSCPALCDPMDCSMSGFPSLLHHLLEFAQTHVHCVNDAIQQSHPLSLPSPPALNLPRHQGLLKTTMA